MKLSYKLSLATAGFCAVIFISQLFVRPWFDPRIPQVSTKANSWLPSIILVGMLIGNSTLFGVFLREPNVHLKRFRICSLTLAAAPLFLAFLFVSISSFFYFDGNCGFMWSSNSCDFNEFLFMQLGGAGILIVYSMGWCLIWCVIATLHRLSRFFDN